MAAHEYWRINVTANDGDPSFLAIAEVEMRAALGGADQCTGGTATASASDGASPPSNAVDNDGSTRWSTPSGTATGWWQYQFASAVKVVEYKIRAHPTEGPRSPRDFTLEYSDNGSDWTVADTRVGVTGWRSGENRVFVAPAGLASGSYSRWLLSFSVNNGHTASLTVAEIEMRATVGGADQLTGGTASASSDDGSGAGAAVDNDPATRWAPTVNLLAGWWQYELASPVSVAEYTIQGHATTETADPKSWTLLGSNDGVDWFLADTQTEQTGWVDGETRTYEIAATEHTLTGNSVNQPNVSASGAVSTEFSLAGNNAAQSSTTSNGAVSSAHTLTGNNCTQPNTSTAGAISLAHILAASSAAQSNTSTGGSVAQAQTLTGNACSQPNASSAGAIIVPHVLTGNNAMQPNTCTSGPLPDAPELANLTRQVMVFRDDRRVLVRGEEGRRVSVYHDNRREMA